MAGNSDPTQPPPLGHYLGPSISLSEGALGFTLGEYILVRIPTQIQIGGNTDTGTATESGLLPTSNAGSTQRFAFVRTAIPLPDKSFQLEVYPQISSTRSGGALAKYNQRNDTDQAVLIPLPPLSRSHPTPEGFGDPLVVGGWSSSRDAWLHVVPAKFKMPWTRPFKRMIPPVFMSTSEMLRIEIYRQTIGVAPDLGDRQARAHPPSEDGSGNDDGPRDVGLRQGAGGQATSGIVSEPMRASWAGGGAQKQALEAELWQFALGLSSAEPPTLESVDEDAEDEDCTTRDELILLARGHPMWAKELVKYLLAEHEERQEVNERRAVRLQHWLQGMTV